MGAAPSSQPIQRAEVELPLEDRSTFYGCGGAGFAFDDEWGTGGDIYPLLTQEEVSAEMHHVNAILHRYVPRNRLRNAYIGAFFLLVGITLVIVSAVGDSCRGCPSTFAFGVGPGVFIIVASISFLLVSEFSFPARLTGAISEIRTHLANNVCPRVASRGVMFTVDSYWTSTDNGHTRKTVWYVGVRKFNSQDATAVANPMIAAAMPMQLPMPMMMPGQQQPMMMQQLMMMQPVPGQYGYAYPGQQPMQPGMPPPSQYYQQHLQQYAYPQQQQHTGMLAGGQQGMVPGKAGLIAPAAIAAAAAGGTLAAGGAALPAWSSGYGANNAYRYDESSPVQQQQQMYQQDQQQYRGYAHGAAATAGPFGGGGGYGEHHHGGAADSGGDAGGHSYGNDNSDPSAAPADGGDPGGGGGGDD